MYVKLPTLCGMKRRHHSFAHTLDALQASFAARADASAMGSNHALSVQNEVLHASTLPQGVSSMLALSGISGCSNSASRIAAC